MNRKRGNNDLKVIWLCKEILNRFVTIVDDFLCVNFFWDRRIEHESFHIYHPPNPCFVFYEIADELLEGEAKCIVKVLQNVVNVRHSLVDVLPTTSVHNRAGVHRMWMRYVLRCFGNRTILRIEIMLVRYDPTKRVFILPPHRSTYKRFRPIRFHELLNHSRLYTNNNNLSIHSLFFIFMLFVYLLLAECSLLS